MLALPLAVVGTHCKHRSFPRMPCCVSRLFVETRQTDLTVFVCWVTTVTCELGASLFLHRFLLPNALYCLWAGGLKGPPRSWLCLHLSTPYHTAYCTLSRVLFKALSICHIVSLFRPALLRHGYQSSTLYTSPCAVSSDRNPSDSDLYIHTSLSCPRCLTESTTPTPLSTAAAAAAAVTEPSSPTCEVCTLHSGRVPPATNPPPAWISIPLTFPRPGSNPVPRKPQPQPPVIVHNQGGPIYDDARPSDWDYQRWK